MSPPTDPKTAHQISPPTERPLILIIDDEPAIGESLAYSLKEAGFKSLSALSLSKADEVLNQHFDQVSLIILDLSLPDGHGFDWLRALRARSLLPVMILSSHDDEIEHIVGLEMGADDFIDKPFSPREVVARVRAVLRRVSQISTQVVASIAHEGDPTTEAFTLLTSKAISTTVVIDYSSYKVLVNERSLGLSQLEFALLETLHLDRRVHTRAQLLEKAWKGGGSVSERTVDVHITALRKKWSEHQEEELIETVRGVGYRLSENAPVITTRGEPIT